MVVFFLIVLGSLSFVSGTSAEPIDVFANSLSLDRGTQLHGSNGTLIYRGGLVLTSPDTRFGGLSGLVISSDGTELVSVSDRGWWLQARLGYDLYGDLDSINVGELTPSATGGLVPSIDTRAVETQVLVRDGQTVVLGGIYETESRETIKKVPFLGDIPGIGKLFRSKTNVSNKSELLIFVTPRILEEGSNTY